jgi:pimeloyl-ACP methyl ester carboxylesterase
VALSAVGVLLAGWAAWPDGAGTERREAGPCGGIAVFFDGTAQPLHSGSVMDWAYQRATGPKVFYSVPLSFTLARNPDTLVRAGHDDVVAVWRNDPQAPVDLFGWSRGAVLAVMLAQRLNEHEPPIPVRFLGLVDPVRTGLGRTGTYTFRPEIPDNVGLAWLGVKEEDDSDWRDTLLFPSCRLTARDAQKTKVVRIRYARNHEQTGFDLDIASDLWRAARGAEAQTIAAE